MGNPKDKNTAAGAHDDHSHHGHSHSHHHHHSDNEEKSPAARTGEDATALSPLIKSTPKDNNSLMNAVGFGTLSMFLIALAVISGPAFFTALFSIAAVGSILATLVSEKMA